ncbi:unnamed protein product [Rotaria sp. Silwood2]|nr:unnamed protein product [Rotaria sp. Silwood2]CAF3995845.1 unnamed protein product [Rotaria sp. Silwood2]
MLCADLCFSNSFALYAYDTIVHQILPNIIIVGFSIGLFIRICWQKRHAGQSLTWRKHWKMALQLLFVSANYLIFGLPLTLMSVFYLCAVPLYVTAKFTQYASFLTYSEWDIDGKRKNFGLNGIHDHLKQWKWKPKVKSTDNQRQNDQATTSIIQPKFAFHKKGLPEKYKSKIKDAELKFIVGGSH